MRAYRSLRVHLKKSDRDELDRVLNGGIQPVRVVLRSLALCQLHDGKSISEVAAKKRIAVCRWNNSRILLQYVFVRSVFGIIIPSWRLRPMRRRLCSRKSWNMSTLNSEHSKTERKKKSTDSCVLCG